MMLSPTVLRFATVALLAGFVIFAAVGLASRNQTVSVGETILAAVVWGGPISAVFGVIVGLVWEKIIRPRLAPAAGHVSGEAASGEIERPGEASSGRRRPRRPGRGRRGRRRRGR